MNNDQKLSNLAEILTLASKLSEPNQKVVTDILELIAKGQQAIQEKNYDVALENYVWPLLVMLSLDFVRHFVAENLPGDWRDLPRPPARAVKEMNSD